MRIKLEKVEQDVNINDDNFKDIMKLVLDYINKNKNDAKAQLLKALMNAESKIEEAMISEEREKERDKLADEILEGIKNNTRKMESRETGVRFQPEIILIALALCCSLPVHMNSSGSILFRCYHLRQH